MKTEAIRLCIQAQYGKEDYAEARKELNALLARLEELEAAQQRVQLTAIAAGGLALIAGIVIGKAWFGG